MARMSADPDGYNPNDIIQRLKRLLESGKSGIDYTIIPRDKNESLIETYVISEQDRIDILKRLTVNEYDGWEYGNNTDFPKDIIHFFHYETSLIPRGIEDAKSKRIKLYIKLTWTKPSNVLIVISFHE